MLPRSHAALLSERRAACLSVQLSTTHKLHSSSILTISRRESGPYISPRPDSLCLFVGFDNPIRRSDTLSVCQSGQRSPFILSFTNPPSPPVFSLKTGTLAFDPRFTSQSSNLRFRHVCDGRTGTSVTRDLHFGTDHLQIIPTW